VSDLVENALVVVKLYGEFSYHAALENDLRGVLLTYPDLVEGADYDIISGWVDDPKLTPSGEEASSKQMWFLGKCINEAHPWRRHSEYLDTAWKVASLEVAEARSRGGVVTKQRASQLIDALKDLTDAARLESQQAS